MTSPHTYFLCSASQWACWIEWHWYLSHIQHHTLCKQICQVFYKGYHQLSYFHQVSYHHFLETRFAVHYSLTCCLPLAEKWRRLITLGEGKKTDQYISVVFLDLNIWHYSSYISSCTSATIEDQIGGIKRCQCHDKDVFVCRMWPDDDWTVGIDSMFRMYHQSKICLFMFWHQAVYGTDIWYWQSLVISFFGQVQACCFQCIWCFPFAVNKPVEEKFDKRRLIFIFMLKGIGVLDLNFCWLQDGEWSITSSCTCGVFPRFPLFPCISRVYLPSDILFCNLLKW